MRAFMIMCAMAPGIQPTMSQTKTVDQIGALSVATLVGLNSPLLPRPQKTLLANALDNMGPAGTKSAPIAVAADSIDCVSSTHELGWPGCQPIFAGKTANLAGRGGVELWNALAVAGVQQDGEAGRVHLAIQKLRCVIDIAHIFMKTDDEFDGKGASCTFGS